LCPLLSGIVDDMNTPQQLSRQAIEEFRTIFQEEFGKRLSDGEIQEIAVRLLQFFGILVEPEVGKTTKRTGSPQRPR
jgi:hypothetical protein